MCVCCVCVQLSEALQHSLLAVGAVSSCGFRVCYLPQILFAACSPLQKKSAYCEILSRQNFSRQNQNFVVPLRFKNLYSPRINSLVSLTSHNCLRRRLQADVIDMEVSSPYTGIAMNDTHAWIYRYRQRRSNICVCDPEGYVAQVLLTPNSLHLFVL